MHLLPPDDDPAAAMPLAWPRPELRPSAQLLDSEEWFSEERLLQRAGAAGGDLP